MSALMERGRKVEGGGKKEKWDRQREEEREKKRRERGRERDKRSIWGGMVYVHARSVTAESVQSRQTQMFQHSIIRLCGRTYIGNSVSTIEQTQSLHKHSSTLMYTHSIYCTRRHL